MPGLKLSWAVRPLRDGIDELKDVKPVWIRLSFAADLKWVGGPSPCGNQIREVWVPLTSSTTHRGVCASSRPPGSNDIRSGQPSVGVASTTRAASQLRELSQRRPQFSKPVVALPVD